MVDNDADSDMATQCFAVWNHQTGCYNQATDGQLDQTQYGFVKNIASRGMHYGDKHHYHYKEHAEVCSRSDYTYNESL